MGNENNVPLLMRVHQGANNLFLGNIGIGTPHPAPVLSSIPPGLTVTGNVSARGSINSGEGIISPNYVYSNNYLGTWNGGPISGERVSVEGVDIKSTIVTPFVKFGGADFYLKATPEGNATWDRITDNEIYFQNNYVDGNLTVVGDIIEYAADEVVFTKTSVFSKDLTAGANTLNTFDKEAFKTAKYVVTLFESAKRTACEILAVHNGTNAEGTTYGIVDAQATSLLTDISVSVGANTIDLVITASSDCKATVNGVAHY